MKKQIILVEDEVIVAMDIQQRLELLGYQVVGCAATGAEAVRLAGNLSPDLIMMDIKLRGVMDGIEAAAQIRTFSNAPIIFLSAFADENTLNRALSTRFSRYLCKPFEDDELRTAIEMELDK